jgi:hypothetical protein
VGSTGLRPGARNSGSLATNDLKTAEHSLESVHPRSPSAFLHSANAVRPLWPVPVGGATACLSFANTSSSPGRSNQRPEWWGWN